MGDVGCGEIRDARSLQNCHLLCTRISAGCWFLWGLECKFGRPAISRSGGSDLWRVQLHRGVDGCEYFSS